MMAKIIIQIMIVEPLMINIMVEDLTRHGLRIHYEEVCHQFLLKNFIQLLKHLLKYLDPLKMIVTQKDNYIQNYP